MHAKTPKTAIIVMVAMLFLTAALYGAQVTSVSICEQVSQPDLVPINITDRFNPDTPEINAVVTVADGQSGSIIKGVWISIDAINVPDYEIAAKELTLTSNGQSTMHFSLSRPDNGWPTGNYKLDLYIDNKLATIKTFSIVAGAGQPAQPSISDQPQPPSPTPQPAYQPAGAGYSGTYSLQSQDVTLSLIMNQDAQGNITGTLSSSTGMQFQLEGMVEEGTALGACYDNQGGAYFEAYLDGDQLYFGLINVDEQDMPDYNSMQEFLFTRTGQSAAPTPPQPTRPSTVTPPAQPQTQSAGQPQKMATTQKNLPTHSGRPGKTYRHPAGFSFWYPDQWTLKEHDNFLQLIPPNPGTAGQDPTELYLLSGESVGAEGIFNPDDPRVTSYMDEQVRAVSPFLQYKGKIADINMSQGKGVLLGWEGKNPRGDNVIARSYVCIIKQHGVALTAIGFTDQIESRSQDLKQMFTSFGFGEGQNDPALIGSWKLASTYAVQNESVWETDWSRAKAVSESKSILEFYPDGRWVRTDEFYMLAGAGDIWLESNDKSSSQGKWNAGDGSLYMVWEDNSYEDYKYRVEMTAQGAKLRLVTGDKGELWERTR